MSFQRPFHDDIAASPVDASDNRATIFLIVGLPGAGKSTRARELEASESALRLTPDEWQITIFGGENPLDKRWLVEGKLVEIGMRAAQLGTSVVFDFGFWGKDERSALRWIAGALGVHSEVVYMAIEHEEQRRRVQHRYETTPHQMFAISDAELRQWRAQFQVPDEGELRGAEIPPVPSPHKTWSQWASKHWPSLPDLCGGGAVLSPKGAAAPTPRHRSAQRSPVKSGPAQAQ